MSKASTKNTTTAAADTQDWAEIQRIALEKASQGDWKAEFKDGQVTIRR